MEITHTLLEDVPGFIQVYEDGFVARFDHRLTPASPQVASDGARSKDVVIDPVKGISARLFLPAELPLAQKLPLLFYFHGGGFCIGTTAWEGYHLFLSLLAATTRALVISVDYRLAPEHRLPAAYDDCFDAVEWVASGGGKAEPWLDAHADYGRCFLAGESAGGNIAHVVGSRTADQDLGPLKIRGLIVIHPYFGSEERIECEKVAAGDDAAALELNDLFWRLALPPGSDRDYPTCNPRGPRSADLRKVPLPPVLVTVAGLDLLKTRGLLYYELLQSCGKEAELMEAEGEIHAYHVFHPRSEATRLLQERMSQFIHRFDA
uniref:prMC3 n=1 Tax=Pinus radiata TaxID=3347 RepID=Q9ZSE0_PINRA|nr:PrMC3 [Pinus radiata]